MDDDAGDMHLTSTDVTLVLRRAAELDSEESGLTAAELVRVAEEAGIERSAILRALEERAGPAPPPAATPDRPLPALPFRGLLAAVLGAGLGVVAQFGYPFINYAMLAALISTLLYLVTTREKERRWDFLFVNLVLWICLAVVAQTPTSTFLEGVAAAALLSSVIGLSLPRGGSEAAEERLPPQASGLDL